MEKIYPLYHNNMDKKRIETDFDNKAQKDLTANFINWETTEFVREANNTIINPTKATITDLLNLDNTGELARMKFIKETENLIEKIHKIPINKQQKNLDYLSQTEETLISLEQSITKIQKELKAKNKIYPNEKEYFEEIDQFIKEYKKMVQINIKIYNTIKLILPKIWEFYSQFTNLEERIKKETNQKNKDNLNKILQIKNEIIEIFRLLRIYWRDLIYNIYSFEEIEETIQEAKNYIKYLSDLTK